MKTKLVTVLFMILVSYFARAEKTFKKDADECTFQGQKISFELRSLDQYTVSEDDDFGQILQITIDGQTQQLDLAQEYPGRHRLMKASNSVCGKSLALKINSEQMAIFLGRDNRPFATTISVLSYNIKTRTAEFLPSKIQANSGFVFGDTAYFQHSSGGSAPVLKTEVIAGRKYNSIEKKFEPWVSFDGKTFRLDRTMSYERFEHKKFIREADLDQLNEFKDLKYSFAISPELSKSCLSLEKGKWNCL